MRVALLITALTLLAAVPDDGLRAWRDGRFAEAHAALAAELRDAGDGATDEQRLNLAYAAIRCGELRDAQLALERADRSADPEVRGASAFLRGNLAWEEARFAAAEAALPDADPTSLPRAIARVEAARRAWMEAGASRPDWPAAARNVERAARKREELELAQAAAAGRDRRKVADEPRVLPIGPDPEATPPEDLGEGTPEEVLPDERAPSSAPLELSAAEREALWAWLERVEREKRRLRSRERAARGATVEKDW